MTAAEAEQAATAKPSETAAEAVFESLDPPDWTAFRQHAHRALDQMLDAQETVAERPPWQPVPSSVESALRTGPPIEGLGLEGAYRDFAEQVLPYPTGNGHPRFWGWVSGTGSPSGMLAEMLAGGLNAVAGPFNDAPARVEAQLIDWMRQALGFGQGTEGIVTSGGSVANLIGLAVARDAATELDVPRQGVAAAPGRLVLYASTETHSSVHKAAQLLGLGREAVRPVAVDSDFRIDLDALEASIDEDRRRGLHPFAVVGNAGTVNTGAIDDLDALADLAARRGLWLHVDGAFGALARLSPDHAPLLRGLERVDSLAFDFHKWLYVPYEAGCVLVQRADRYRATFDVPASYLHTLPRGVAAQPDSTNLRGLQLSRGFKALKAWLLIKEHGLARYGRLIARNVEQARYLAGRIDATEALERLAPVPLNVVCFHWVDRRFDGQTTDAINREILMRLHEEGLAVPSSTVVGGRFALRTAITNHRSQHSDFDFLVAQVERLGREIADTFRAAP